MDVITEVELTIYSYKKLLHKPKSTRKIKKSSFSNGLKTGLLENLLSGKIINFSSFFLKEEMNFYSATMH